MRALAPHRQTAPVRQTAIAAEVHEPLDVHGGLTPQIAFHDIVTIDHFANLQHFLVGELRDAPLVGNPDRADDLTGLRGPNTVNVLQTDKHSLIGRYIDTSDTRQGRLSFGRSITFAAGKPRWFGV